MKLFFLIAPLIVARKYNGKDGGPHTPVGFEPKQKCDHATRRLSKLIASKRHFCESKTDMEKCGLCSTIHDPCYWKRFCELVCPESSLAADPKLCRKLCKKY